MPTPEKTEEQKRQDAQAAAEKKQIDARNELAISLGQKPNPNPQFSILEKITNAFTDTDSGRPDWLKLLVAGIGGIVGTIFGADLGLGGAALVGIVGAALGGIAGNFLIPMIRGDDPNKLPRTWEASRPFAPDANAKVISQVPLHLGNATVTIPVYDPKENPAAKKSMADIERLRAVLADGNPVISPANKEALAFMKVVENSSNVWEMNMRYLRDTLPQTLQSSADQVDHYLNKTAPDQAKTLSVKLDMNLNDVPGQHGKLTEDLEIYGQAIKDRLLKEVAASHNTTPQNLGIESDKVIQNAWDNLSVIAKRTLIGNFAKQAKEDALNNALDDAGDFFPEYEGKTFLGFNLRTNWHGLMTNGFRNMFTLSPLSPVAHYATNDLEHQFDDAIGRRDYQAMAEILKQQLNAHDNDKDRPEGQRLDEGTKRKMRTIILGFEGAEKTRELSKYIDDQVRTHDIPKLQEFESALIERNTRVQALQAFAKAHTPQLSPDAMQQAKDAAIKNSLAFANATGSQSAPITPLTQTGLNASVKKGGAPLPS